MQNFILILTLMTSATALADTNCNPIRQGKATVQVNRLYWQQTDGNWTLHSEEICKGSGELKVLPGRASGCMYDKVLECNSQVDGKEHAITVSGMIYHADNGKGMEKYFVTAYNIDRDKDPAMNSQLKTRDLSLKNIGVYMNSQINYPENGSPGLDSISVDVDFEDLNAP